MEIETAIAACESASESAAAAKELIRRFRAGETFSNLQDDLDVATGGMLAAAEAILAAVHEYQIADRRITGGL